ncbi:helix-turn-helix domain-containing protein [Ghiorsea bivora]|uniref:helix-turn-helix domain-containing protein n=1 Tax=Ghiorsea bivora TaxID=1485545 RepID=UPI0005719930|nr:helix-turn-helix transcriptional regulator [Ghiorsea bivora]
MSRNFNNSTVTFRAMLGNCLKNIRQLKHIEQAYIASHVGISQSTWSKIERGESSISVSQLVQAARLFNIQPSDILLNVETLIRELESQGVHIEYEKVVNSNSTATSFVGGAALGALITAVLMSDKK